MTPFMQTQPLLFLSLLLTLTLPLHATLVVGSEKGVTAPALDVAAFAQDHGRIATDGDTFLAVWIDHTLSGIGDIHGARVASTGKRIDDEVLRIAVTDGDENRVALAFGGNRYLVAWATPTALRARFVGRDGSMSDVIDIATPSNGFALPQIAFDGTRFLIVWSAGPVFRGATIDTNGAVLKTFDIVSTAQTFFEPALVAANGAFHFVTAITDFNGVPNGNGYPSDIGVTTIDGNGTVAARVVVAPATTPVFDVRAVSSGNELLIAWSTALGIPGGTVRAVRITAAGVGEIETIPAEGAYLHDIAFDSAGFLVIYGADATKFVRRLGASEPFSFVATPETKTTILDAANNGASTLVLVSGDARVGFRFGPVGGDLYITRLETQEIEPLVVAPRHQSSPDIAAAGDLRLAVWCEYIGSERRLGIIGSRLTADGSALDANGIDVHTSVYHPVAPRVASNGADWLIVWVDGTNVYGSRVSHSGTPLDAAPLLIASQIFDDSDVAVSWDGTQYVVVYFRGQFLRGLRTTVRAARVTAQGTLPAPELTLSEETANELPAIGSGPEGSLVVWRGGVYLQGALLSRSGTVTRLGFPSTNPVGPRPSVAWNSGTFIVAAPFRGAFGDEIQWLLVSDTGVIRTPLSTFLDIDASIESGTGFPTVDVEAYGDGFLVFWNGVGTDAQLRAANVYAARINREGILADAAKVIGSTVVDHAPSIGATGNLVVYSRKIGHTTRELARVFARDVQYTPGKPRRRAVR